MYQISELRKFPKLFHVFSTKADGNMSNSILGKRVDFKKVLKNREKFFNKINIDIDKCACMWVVHDDGVIRVPEEIVGVSMKEPEKAIKVDGLMTDEKGVYLFLLIADCLPIIFYDPEKGVITLVHAGWKGVYTEIARKAVENIQKEYGSMPRDIIIGIGPYAHKESFIKESPAQKSDPRWNGYINKVGPYYQVDLLGFTKKQLMETGVLEENIYVSDVDTVKDERFFSHVRECNLPIEQQGRFACVVGII